MLEKRGAEKRPREECCREVLGISVVGRSAVEKC